MVFLKSWLVFIIWNRPYAPNTPNTSRAITPFISFLAKGPMVLGGIFGVTAALTACEREVKREIKGTK